MPDEYDAYLRSLSPREPREAAGFPGAEPVLPEDQESLLMKGLRGVWGGAQWLGSTLGKPGAAIRGLTGNISDTLEGRPTDWWNGAGAIIPFSDSLGITDPNKRVSTSDLLDHWGWHKPTGNTAADWAEWGLRGAASLGGDVATDWAGLKGVPSLLPKTLTGLRAADEANAAATEGVLPEVGKPFSETLGKVAAKFNADQLGTTGYSSPLHIGEQVAEGERTLFGWPGISKGLEGPAADERSPLNFFLTPDQARGLVESVGHSPFSPVSWIRGAFSSSNVSGPAFNAWTQKANDIVANKRALQTEGADTFKAAALWHGRVLEDTYRGIADAANKAGDAPTFQQFSRSLFERYGVPSPEQIRDELDRIMTLTPNSPQAALRQASDLQSRMHDFMDAIWSVKNAVKRAGDDYGLDPVALLNDPMIEHFPRSSRAVREDLAAPQTSNWRSNATKTFIDPSEHRAPATHGSAGGSGAVHKLSTDPAYMGFQATPNPEMLAALRKTGMTAEEAKWALPMEHYGAEKLGKEDWIKTLQDAVGPKGKLTDNLDELRDMRAVQLNEPEFNAAWPAGVSERTLQDGSVLTKAQHAAAWQTAGSPNLEKLRGYLDAMPKTIWKNGVFDRPMLDDAFEYIRSMSQREATGANLWHFLDQEGVQVKEGGVPLTQAWEAAGLRKEAIENWVAAKRPDELERLAPAGSLEDRLAAAQKIADGVMVNPQAIPAMRSFNRLSSGKEAGPIGKALDHGNDFYKSMLANVWPAAYIRDFPSRFFNQWAHGEVGPLELAKGYGIAGGYAKALRSAGGEGGLVAAEHGFLPEYVALSGRTPSELIELMSKGSERYRGIPAGGLYESLIGSPAKKAFRRGESGSWLQGINPLNAPGLTSGENPYNIAQEMGLQVRQFENFIQRGGHYQALREAGYAPGQAMNIVNEANFDFSKMSGFDRDVMRRAAPFWGFLRMNVPYQMSRIVSNPAGLTGLTMSRLSAAESEGQGEYTPTFLRESGAFHAGGPSEAANFYRNTLLPFNDLNDLVFKGGAPDLGRTAEKLVSRATPLALFPLEGAAGKQLYTGRKLADLEPVTGQRWLDAALHYSPASRVVSEGAALADPRKDLLAKALNILGLGKISTYDTDKWKLRDLREELGKRLAAAPEVKEWEDYYLPKNLKESLAESNPEKLAAIEAMIKQRGGLTKELSQQNQQQHAQLPAYLGGR